MLMKKNMAGLTRLGVNKTNNLNKKVTKRGVFNYLKSDSFLYSHLISTPPPSLQSPDSPPLQDKEKIESGEFVDYMKSDSYLYSPLDLVLVTHPPSPSPPPKHSGNQVQLKKVRKEILFTRISAHKTRGTPKVVAEANGYNLRRT